MRRQRLTLRHFLTSWTRSHLSPAACAPLRLVLGCPWFASQLFSGVTLLHWALTAPGVLGSLSGWTAPAWDASSTAITTAKEVAFYKVRRYDST